jgi:hypothetical protein
LLIDSASGAAWLKKAALQKGAAFYFEREREREREQFWIEFFQNAKSNVSVIKLEPC